MWLLIIIIDDFGIKICLEISSGNGLFSFVSFLPLTCTEFGITVVSWFLLLIAYEAIICMFSELYNYCTCLILFAVVFGILDMNQELSVFITQIWGGALLCHPDLSVLKVSSSISFWGSTGLKRSFFFFLTAKSTPWLHYMLRVVEWVSLIRFLFGMCHY